MSIEDSAQTQICSDVFVFKETGSEMGSALKNCFLLYYWHSSVKMLIDFTCVCVCVCVCVSLLPRIETGFGK